VAGREWRRGLYQTLLLFVWSKTRISPSDHPSRGLAASTRRRAKWKKPALAIHSVLEIRCRQGFGNCGAKPSFRDFAP
jgi:hypothetical protein